MSKSLFIEHLPAYTAVAVAMSNTGNGKENPLIAFECSVPSTYSTEQLWIPFLEL